MIIGVDHLGIAVGNLDNAVHLYQKILGFTCLGTEEVESQKVRVAFFRVGETAIELLEATEENSPIARHIATRGEGFHHISFRVDDIATTLNSLRNNGIRLINEEPVLGAHGAKVAFLHPKSTGGLLVELCEQSEA